MNSRAAFKAPAAAAAAVAILAIICLSGAHAQAYKPDNIGEAADAAVYLGKFKDAAVAAGYGDILVDPEWNGTIFAPVDAAFAADARLSNASWVAENVEALAPIVAFHIVPDTMAFPPRILRDGGTLQTLEGQPLLISRTVPGLIHIYGTTKIESDPSNMATILQYQQLRSGRAVLYVIDRMLVPPATAAAAPERTARVKASDGSG